MNFFPYSVSVIIPNWNGMAWLPGCLDALKKQSIRDFEIIIVDNGSSDESISYLQNTHPDVRIIPLEKNYGFSVAVNAGIREAKGKYLILLNNDTLPEQEWIFTLLRVIEDSPAHVGSLASFMTSMDNPSCTDDAGDYIDWNGFAYKRGHGDPVSHWTRTEQVFSACAGAALYRREFFDSVGMFDEKFGSYLEDIDLGLRGNLLGFSCVFVPSARVLHKSHGSAIPASIYVYHVTKNRAMLFLKNIPFSLLIRRLRSLFMGQIHSFLIYKDPLSSIRAYWYLLWNIPAIYQDRRRVLAQVVLSNEEIDQLFKQRGRAQLGRGRNP